MKKRLIALCLSLVVFVVITSGIFLSEDSLSQWVRGKTETFVNTYVENLTDKAIQHQLSAWDKAVLNIGAVTGIAVSSFSYPEASSLLYHYIYGDGSDLQLDASYFQGSHYLAQQVKALGLGQHGPIALKQYQDWRLSLALNPYYIDITDSTIKIYHPEIIFAPLESDKKVMTVVPIGKMRLKIYDNLVSALNPKPFYVYAEWSNHPNL